jgi:hypothetical protein
MWYDRGMRNNKYKNGEQMICDAGYTTLACLMFGLPAIFIAAVCPTLLVVVIPVGVMMVLICNAD